MAEELKENLGVEATLIKGTGGIFEVIADGEMVFKKMKSGDFPEKGLVTERLKAR